MNDENHSLLKGSIPITAKNCTLKLISSVMIQPVDSILWHSYTAGVRDRSSYPHCCEAQLTCWWELSAQPPSCLSIHCSVSLIGLSAPVCPECTHTHTFLQNSRTYAQHAPTLPQVSLRPSWYGCPPVQTTPLTSTSWWTSPALWVTTSSWSSP